MGLDHLTTKLLRPCNVCMQNQINILLFWNMHAIGGEGMGREGCKNNQQEHQK
jgi:hypothetical protein